MPVWLAALLALACLAGFVISMKRARRGGRKWRIGAFLLGAALLVFVAYLALTALLIGGIR